MKEAARQLRVLDKENRTKLAAVKIKGNDQAEAFAAKMEEKCNDHSLHIEKLKEAIENEKNK